MKLIVGTLCAAVFLLLVILLAAYICFYMVFYVPKRKQPQTEEFSLPDGEIYEAFRDVMIAWMTEVRAMPHEDVTITSFDGLTLRGKYYEYAPGAPIELMMHGYRGGAERDLAGGVQRCFQVGRSALIVDQRCCGKSGGRVITFGIREYRDCLSWIRYINGRFGNHTPIILSGLSMGAATVIMAAALPLPDNVKCILADSPYSAPDEIIWQVCKDRHFPVKLVYPFIRFAARVFAGFNLEQYSATAAASVSPVPILLLHGDDDRFVPCEMSHHIHEMSNGCTKLVTFMDAGHGLSYIVEPERYEQTVLTFLKQFFPVDEGIISSNSSAN